jgi:hypothetical protein
MNRGSDIKRRRTSWLVIPIVAAVVAACCFGQSSARANESAAPAIGARPGSVGCPSTAPKLELSDAYKTTVDQALASKTDLWGEQLLQQPGGPTYDSAKALLPPLMYAVSPPVNGPSGWLSDSGVYYIPFGVPDPDHPTARGSIALHVADGSQITSGKVGNRSTRFFVGKDGAERYGECIADLSKPQLEGGYLPILQTSYVDHDGVHYQQESFAGYLPGTTTVTSYVKLVASRGNSPDTTTKIRIQDDCSCQLVVDGDELVNPGDHGTHLYFSSGATWDGTGLTYDVDLSDGKPHTMYVVRVNNAVATPPENADAADYDAAKHTVSSMWKSLLGQGATFSVPEPYAMDAEKASLVQNLLMTWRYSIGNAYEAFYQPESSDAVQTLGEYGFTDVYKDSLQDLLPLSKGATQRDKEIGHKLYHAVDHWWLTGDPSLIENNESVYEGYAAQLAAQNAADPNHLLEKEQYATDLKNLVYALHPIAVAQHGLQVMAEAWGRLGRPDLASKYGQVAANIEDGLRAAAAASQQTLPDGSLFTKAALLEDEPAYDQLTGTTLGSYWNLAAPYAFAAGLYPPGSPEATGTLQYLYQHGSRQLGLVRFQYGSVDPVYSLEQNRFLADNDQADQLVLGFYGLLAGAMTQKTFVTGENANVGPLASKWPACQGQPSCVFPPPADGWAPDEYYRAMARPPNSAENATFLDLLHLMLVHQVVTSSTQEPSGLQLAHFTPRAWLEQGKTISVEKAPTAFGPLSYAITSDVAHHHVQADVQVPSRDPLPSLSLRLRVPAGLRMVNVHVNGAERKAFDPQTETIDLSGLTGALHVDVNYAAAR